MLGSMIGSVRGQSCLVCEESEQCANNGTGFVFSEWVSVGCEGQVSKLTDMLASSKWPMDRLKCEMAGEG
jgi:hypothetical protein